MEVLHDRRPACAVEIPLAARRRAGDVSVLRQGGESRDHNAMHPQGLLPPDYEKSFAGVWEYATAWDVGKAAKDWPQMNFVIYHSALRPFLELPDKAWAEFESTGRIRWA